MCLSCSIKGDFGMAICNVYISNVLSFSNCKSDKGRSKQDTYKPNNSRKHIYTYCKNFDEVLANEQASRMVDISTPKFDAIGDVLEDIFELKGLDVKAQLSSIKSRQSNKELETVLGVSSDYYRDKYFALLRVLVLAQTLNSDSSVDLKV